MHVSGRARAVPGGSRAARLVARRRCASGRPGRRCRRRGRQGCPARGPPGADAEPVLRGLRSGPGPARCSRAVRGLVPTLELVTALAVEHDVFVHGSLFEAVPESEGGPPPTAAASTPPAPTVPDGALVSATRKVHIPVTAGYYEDRYFIGSDGGFPVVPVDNARFGFPTCWDQWFPETSRAYSLAGAEVLVYPTAIGSEPDHPGFDTEPLWHAVIVGQGIGRTVTSTFCATASAPRTSAPGRRSRSTARRSSAIPTAGSSSRLPVTGRRCSSPTSTSTPAATGSSCSRS